MSVVESNRCDVGCISTIQSTLVSTGPYLMFNSFEQDMCAFALSIGTAAECTLIELEDV